MPSFMLRWALFGEAGFGEGLTWPHLSKDPFRCPVSS